MFSLLKTKQVSLPVNFWNHMLVNFLSKIVGKFVDQLTDCPVITHVTRRAKYCPNNAQIHFWKNPFASSIPFRRFAVDAFATSSSTI